MQVPLVRVEGKMYGDDNDVTSGYSCIGHGRLLRTAKTAGTRSAEMLLGLEDSLYFYVGHAHPSFGDAVLVYDAEMTSGLNGGATPFDTGGLAAGFLHARSLEAPTGKNHEEKVREYFALHRVILVDWSDSFDDYVARHFATKEAYVDGERPTADDATGRLHHPENERRAWTWEIQLYADHDLCEGLLFALLTYDVLEWLRIEFVRSGESHLAEFLKSVIPAPPGRCAEEICLQAEGEVRRRL